MLSPTWLSLTKTLIKNGPAFSWTKSRRFRWLYVLLGVGFVPLMVALLWLVAKVITDAYTVFAAVGQTEMLLQLVVTFLLFFSIIFSLTLVLNSFYFSADVEFLLGLPLKPRTIVTSKLLVLLILESFFNLLVAGAAFWAFGQAASASGLYYLGAVIGTLTFSLTPLLISSIIMMILMSLTRWLRNKEFVSKYSGLVSVVLVLIVTFAFSLLGGLSDVQVEAFFEGTQNSIWLKIFSWLFPYGKK